VDAERVDRPLATPDLTALTLLARDGFADHVEVLAGPVGEGLWLPHEYAELQGVEVGDELRLSARRGSRGTWTPTDGAAAPRPEPVTVPVAAIYRDLRAAPDTPYWCGVAEVYRGSSDPIADPPPPTALLDVATFLRVGETAQLVAGQVVELRVTDPRLSAAQAARLAAEIEALRVAVIEQHPRLFPTGYYDDTDVVSSLDRYQRRAALVRTGLLPPVLPITAAGVLVGLAVAAAAAVFWVQRRRQELTVLAAHGVGAGALGVKAVTEALPAVMAGAAAGWAAAWALVVGVGPSPVLAPGALPLAAVTAGATAVVALLLIGGLAAGGARGLADARPVGHGVGWWRRVPWELGLVAAAPVAWWLLADDQTVDATAGGVGTVAHVPARLLVAPILAVAGGAVPAARLAARWLRRRGPARTPAGPARLLAWRRSVRVATTTAVLAGATAVPVAMATYAATAVDSIRTTADAQLRFNLGSDTVVSYPRPLERGRDGAPPPPSVPAALADRATEVLRFRQQHLDGLIVDVIGVDPETFTDGAFWDNRIPGERLADAVGRLTAGDTPVVIASRRIAPGPATLTVRGEQIPVRVGGTRPLPGAQPAYPLVMVHRDALANHLPERVLSGFTPQVWIAGDPDRTLAAITEARLPVARVATVDEQRVGAVYEPVTYTFQYLIALSGFTGLIATVGLLLYLESRTAAHRRAYVVLRRLGLRPGAHRRALLLEIGGPVAAGLAAGLAGAVGLAYALRSGFDVDPERFPAALLVLPTTMTAGVCAAAAAVALGAGLLFHARVSRARPAEVLRDTT
jgi:putative ABC transport system permease protein